MANLNEKICVQGGANTGFGDCVLNPGLIVGAFLFRQETVFTPADLADFPATLAAMAGDAQPSERVYPIHSFEALTDNTEDNTEETLGYGAVITLREGRYNWLLRFIQGGVCLLKSLRKFNGSGNHVLFYDANGVVIGQRQGDNLVTIPLDEFWAQSWRPGDGTTSSTFNVKFLFQAPYINDNIGFVDLESVTALRNVKGLQDVGLSELAGSAVPILEMGAKTNCGAENLHDDYAALLADPAMWVATNAATGADITITGVVDNPTAGGWTVTLDSADPDYPATGGTVYVNLADTETLAAAGVEGYEGIRKAITVPATT